MTQANNLVPRACYFFFNLLITCSTAYSSCILIFRMQSGLTQLHHSSYVVSVFLLFLLFRMNASFSIMCFVLYIVISVFIFVYFHSNNCDICYIFCRLTCWYLLLLLLLLLFGWLCLFLSLFYCPCVIYECWSFTLLVCPHTLYDGNRIYDFHRRECASRLLPYWFTFRKAKRESQRINVHFSCQKLLQREKTK